MERLILENQLIFLREMLTRDPNEELRDAILAQIGATRDALGLWGPEGVRQVTLAYQWLQNQKNPME